VYADDINILGGSVHTVKKKADDLAVASKEIGLEVNADKNKYMNCLEIRMQEDVTVSRMVIVPLKGWKS
jgi:hypothetical protein